MFFIRQILIFTSGQTNVQNSARSLSMPEVLGILSVISAARHLAFKMRQDYLSASYWAQKYLPSEWSKTIPVTCAEMISLSHFESIWWDLSHTFGLNIFYSEEIGRGIHHDNALSTPFTFLTRKYVEI